MTELFSHRNLSLSVQHKFDLDQLFKTKMKSINDGTPAAVFGANVNASPSSTNSQTMLTNSSFSSSSSSSPPSSNANVSGQQLDVFFMSEQL